MSQRLSPYKLNVNAQVFNRVLKGCWIVAPKKQDDQISTGWHWDSSEKNSTWNQCWVSSSFSFVSTRVANGDDQDSVWDIYVYIYIYIYMEIWSELRPLLNIYNWTNKDMASNLPDQFHPDPGSHQKPIPRIGLGKDRVILSCSCLQLMPT